MFSDFPRGGPWPHVPPKYATGCGARTQPTIARASSWSANAGLAAPLAVTQTTGNVFLDFTNWSTLRDHLLLPAT